MSSLKEEVLLALLHLGIDQPAAPIFQRIDDARKAHTGKGLSFGSVFTTLNRLAEDKLIDTKTETSKRGRKFLKYTINANGQKALNEANMVRAALSEKKKDDVSPVGVKGVSYGR